MTNPRKLNNIDIQNTIDITKSIQRDITNIIKRIQRFSSLDSSVTDSDGNPAIPMGYRNSPERASAISELEEAIEFLDMDIESIKKENPDFVERELKLIDLSKKEYYVPKEQFLRSLAEATPEYPILSYKG